MENPFGNENAEVKKEPQMSVGEFINLLNERSSEEQIQSIENLPVTSLEEYLELLKTNPIESTEHSNELNELGTERAKIRSRLENELNGQYLQEMEKLGFIEGIGFFPEGNEMTHEEYLSYFGDGYVVKSITLYGDNLDTRAGEYFFRERTANLTEEENLIKAQLVSTYNMLSDEKWSKSWIELNKQKENSVQNGELAFLGKKTFDEYIEMLKTGLPYTGIEMINIPDETDSITGAYCNLYGKLK